MDLFKGIILIFIAIFSFLLERKNPIKSSYLSDTLKFGFYSFIGAFVIIGIAYLVRYFEQA